MCKLLHNVFDEKLAGCNVLEFYELMCVCVLMCVCLLMCVFVDACLCFDVCVCVF